MFWFLILTVFGSLYYYFITHVFNYWNRKGVKQKMPLTPLGDNAQILISGYSLFDMIKNVYDRFPDERYTGAYLFCSPVLMLRDPELIKDICVRDYEYFLDHKHFQSEHADPLFNKNMFALTGQKWKNMRKALNPAFTSSKLRKMFVLMQECAENFATHFLQNTEEVQEVELKDNFSKYTNDIIATTVFGIHCNSLKQPNNDIFVMGKQTTDFSGLVKRITFHLTRMVPILGKVFKVSLFDKEASIFFKTVIKETMEYRHKNKVERSDMLNILMQISNIMQNEDRVENNDDTMHETEEPQEFKQIRKRNLNLSLDDITAQALVFFFAGYDTVSAALSVMAYELAINPDVQQRLIEELDEFKASNSTLVYDALSELTYLDMVVSEMLRKWPPIMLIDRKCVKPYTIAAKQPNEKSVDLVEGDIVLIPIYALHHDPKHFENPEKFDPERFSPENKDKIIPYTYLPFGTGPRICIGNRYAEIAIKILFYELLTRFEIIPTKKSVIPLVPGKQPFTLSSAHGLWWGLKKRNNTVL